MAAKGLRSGTYVAAAAAPLNNRQRVALAENSSNLPSAVRQTPLPNISEGVELADLGLNGRATAACRIAPP